MTMWRPQLPRKTGPLYLRLAEAIASDLAAGRLAPGTRLPPQREMAEFLGTTVATVMNGYQEAQRRGLLTATVGRGTFVREIAVEPSERVIDLTVNSLAPGPFTAALLASAATLGDAQGAAALAEYHTGAGRASWREAGAAWVRDLGVPATPDQVVVTAGAQHGILVALAALARPRAVLLVEEHTYPGVRTLAGYLHLRLEPIPMDRDGLRPDALAAACARTHARLLYTMPTLHNPTAITMSRARRRALVKVAVAHDLSILEDDAYGFLDQAEPLASLAPERCWYLTTLSKSLAAGTRVGYLRVPDAFIEKARAAVSATLLMSSPFTAELATRWIADGTARHLASWKREEYYARQVIARRVLGLRTPPSASPHVWWTLPDSCPAHDFAEQARRQGVLVSPGTVFAVRPKSAHDAVRICLGPPPTRERLEEALRTLAAIRRQVFPASAPVV